MEKPPGNPLKRLDLKALSNLPKRVHRWDLLLVDDHGKVMSFQYIKGLVICFMIVVLLSLALSVFLIFLYHNTQKKVGELKNSLEISRKDAVLLQEEMRDLMVRLAKAQSELQNRQARKVTRVTKKTSPRISTQTPSVAPQADAKAGRIQKTAEKKSVSLESSATQSLMKMEMGVFDFSAAYDVELSAVGVRFIIKNINRNVSEIPGYIFAILKTDKGDQKEWLTIPSVKLISGKPASIKAGQYFKIRNFKTVELYSSPVTGPKTFSSASILVYSTKGDLILEKTHRVEIHVAEKAAVEPPTPVPETEPHKQHETPDEKSAVSSPPLEETEKEAIPTSPTPEKDPDDGPDQAEKE